MLNNVPFFIASPRGIVQSPNHRSRLPSRGQAAQSIDGRLSSSSANSLTRRSNEREKKKKHLAINIFRGSSLSSSNFVIRRRSRQPSASSQPSSSARHRAELALVRDPGFPHRRRNHAISISDRFAHLSSSSPTRYVY